MATSPRSISIGRSASKGRSAAVSTGVALAGFALHASAAHAQAPAADFDARARQVVSQMTLDEKISQMHGTQTKTVYRIVVGVPRLGIPDLLITNGPAGFGPAGPGHQGKATALPAPISLAATWDVDAAKDYGALAAQESLDLGNTLLEAPDINIARVPQNGRTFEAWGEDPFLVGRLAVANILGIQSQGVLANVKHFAGNNQEAQRTKVNDIIDERTLREIYLPAFEVSVKEGHVGSVMAAYNKVNGPYCAENDVLLNQILKKEWGFPGFVTSDFGAVHTTVPTATNGLDLELPSGRWLGALLKTAVDAGQVPISVIDEHLIRRFRTMMQFGIWDKLPAQKPIPEKADGAVALRLAEEGMVLLKNDHDTLPLKPGVFKSIALIGSYADHAATGGGGSSRVDPLYTVTPIEGLQARLGRSVIVTVSDTKDTEGSVVAAKAADLVILMIGDRQSEGSDHKISLDVADRLVNQVLDVNKHVIVVLKCGGPVLMPWIDRVPAVLEAWYPGEEDGNAVAAVLNGDYNPSGKLPMTFPKQLADVPASTPAQYPGVDGEAQYSEGVFVGYRWYDEKKIEPLFPFGFGLSYTTFKYSGLALSATTLTTASPTLAVDFDIANTGSRAGAEVAQVYLSLPSLPGVPQPPRQLKGFARVTVDAGKTAHAHVTLDTRAFSYWDATTHGWKIAPGVYTISVGGSSRDLPLKEEVTVK